MRTSRTQGNTTHSVDVTVLPGAPRTTVDLAAVCTPCSSVDDGHSTCSDTRHMATCCRASIGTVPVRRTPRRRCQLRTIITYPSRRCWLKAPFCRRRITRIVDADCIINSNVFRPVFRSSSTSSNQRSTLLVRVRHVLIMDFARREQNQER
jgi:hypothetical protein